MVIMMLMTAARRRITDATYERASAVSKNAGDIPSFCLEEG